MPRYSIITPTIARPSLLKTAESLLIQTNEDWEWLISVDTPLITQPKKKALIDSLPNKDSRIKITRCGVRHGFYGNRCRNLAFDRVQGTYIIYVDDDDYLSDDRVFETLEQVTASWAIWPVVRCGEYWFNDPPGMCKTGSGHFMYRRDTGLRYPANENYSADGELVEALKAAYPYQSLARERPLLVYPQRGLGKE